MFKRALCWAVVGLLAFGFLGGLTSAENAIPDQKSPPVTQPRAYTPHAPIKINNDNEFNASFSNRTIWNLEINGTGYGCCIYIGNCSQSFTVKDCYLHNASGKNDYYFENTGIYIYNSSNGILSNSNCNGNNNGVYLNYYSNTCTLTSNNCSRNQNGIILVASDANVLTNNNCFVNSANGIFLGSSKTNTLIDNTCNKNEGGICLDGSSTNIITNNNCNGNTVGLGLSYSDSNILTGNTCDENKYDGINMWFSNTNPLIGNNCNGNLGYGINLINSNTKTFTHNTCNGSSEDGIYMIHSPANTISYNNIINNLKYGLNIPDRVSIYNHIYHNNFIGNNGGGNQAYDNSSTNFWNSSYPDGGNYWSDWTSPDVKKGPNQDQSGSDGIVDSPYILDGGAGAQDHYPLTSKVVVPEPSPAPLVMIGIILFVAIVIRTRKR